MAGALAQIQVPAAVPTAAAAALAQETCRVWRLSLLGFQQKDHCHHQRLLKFADAADAAAAAMSCHHLHAYLRAAAAAAAAAAVLAAAAATMLS